MGRIGLSDQFFLPKNIEWEGSFYMQQKTQISKDDIPCSEVCVHTVLNNKPRYSECPLVVREVSSLNLDYTASYQRH